MLISGYIKPTIHLDQPPVDDNLCYQRLGCITPVLGCNPFQNLANSRFMSSSVVIIEEIGIGY